MLILSSDQLLVNIIKYIFYFLVDSIIHLILEQLTNANFY